MLRCPLSLPLSKSYGARPTRAADAACDAGLALIDERDLWIDRETAAQTFGTGSIRCMPNTPIYWMLSLAKSTAVANGHQEAAPLNGCMFAQQAAVTS